MPFACAINSLSLIFSLALSFTLSLPPPPPPLSTAEDLGPFPTTLTIAPDQSSVTVNIPLVDDAISEAQEGFGVRVIATDERIASPLEPVVIAVDDNDGR